MKYISLLILIGFGYCGFAQTNDDLNKQLDLAYALESEKPDSALLVYRNIYQKAQQEEDSFFAFKALQYSGIVFSDNGNYDSAFVYYNKALKLSKTIPYKTGEGSVYINLGNVYLFKSKYPEAIEQYHKGIRIYEELQDTLRLPVAYRNLSGLYREIEDYKNYDIYLNKSIKVTRDPNNLAYLNNDLIKFYIDKGKLEKAKITLDKTLKLVESINDERIQFFTNRNQGEYFRAINKPQDALVYYTNAEDNIQGFKDVYFEMDLYKVMSYAYIDIGRVHLAEKYVLKTLNLAETLQAEDVISKCYLILAEIDHIKNPSKAYSYLKQGMAINDSIKQSKYYNKIAVLEEKFQSKTKDVALAHQKAKLDQLEVDALKRQNQLYASTLTGSVLVIVGLFFIWYFKKQGGIKEKEISHLKLQKEKEKLESLITGEELERKRLAKELHDGINGDLSALKYKLLSIDLSGFSSENKAKFTESVYMLDQSCSLIRHVSHNLAPPSIRDFGLLESVKQFIRKLNAFEQAEIEFQYYGSMLQFSEVVETNIYRIIQELTLNAVKHAEARSIIVQMNFNDDLLNITVEDDGKGFDVKNKSEGIGLKNSLSRVEFLEGNMEIDSTPRGTSILISFLLNTLEHHDKNSNNR